MYPCFPMWHQVRTQTYVSLFTCAFVNKTSAIANTRSALLKCLSTYVSSVSLFLRGCAFWSCEIVFFFYTDVLVTTRLFSHGCCEWTDPLQAPRAKPLIFSFGPTFNSSQTAIVDNDWKILQRPSVGQFYFTYIDARCLKPPTV